MKLSKSLIFALAMLGGATAWLAGCGSSTVNVITVTITPPAALVIAGQTTNFTATVNGATVTTVSTWTCSYSYTPEPTQSIPTPKAVTGTCTSGGTISGVKGSVGTWTISTANGSNVLSYVAPALANFPIPAPTLTFTAEADANTKKTGTATVTLDSGIRVSVLPIDATVPVGITPALTANFYPSFYNTNPTGAQFKLVQPNTASTTTADQTATPITPDTCDPTCGTIDNNGVYTAPATLPTDTKPSGSKSTSATSVYVVVWNSADNTQYALASITLVAASANAIDFTGIYPTTVAAGGIVQDVFLNARNLLNSSLINFVPPTAQANLTPSSGTPLSTTTQVFTIPVSTEYCAATAAGVTPVITCDASILTRVRLGAAQLASAEPDQEHPAWLMIPTLPGTVTPSGQCVQVPNPGASTTAIACPLHIVNASPALVAAAPDSFPQATGSGTISLGVDGGYFGATGTGVNMSFNGQTILLQSSQSGPRSLFGSQSNFQLPNPGLYEITVTNNSTAGTPPLFKTATTNAAVQPNFATAPVMSAPVPLNTTAASGLNLAPSSIALDSVKGYAVLTEQASNTLQLISLTGTGPVQIGNPFSLVSASTPTALGPTGIAIDDQLNVNGGDLGVVVSSGDSALYLYSITPQAAPYFTFVKAVSVDLNVLLNHPSAGVLPTPYAFGVDPGTHLGVVAYSVPVGTGIGTSIGFIVDVNPNLDNSDTHTCFVQGQTPPCVIAPVSMVTGPTPQVVMQPQAPLAYVTPGGGIGTTSVVDLLQQGTSAKILPYVAGGTSGAVRTAGLTTIRTATPHQINAALGGTVIISGITTTTPNSNFNGTFLVNVIDPYTFTYAQTGMPEDTENNAASSPGEMQYGLPYYTFSTSTTVSGAAINPVTRTFAYADYQSTSGQIGFISTLDQSLTSLSLSAGSCNGCVPTQFGPEFGFRSVAFDPFTNVLMAYNPDVNVGPNFSGNAISLINPGGPAAGGNANPAYRIIASIPTNQVGTGSYTPAGATTPVNVYGPMAYDPKTKYVLVASAGANTLTYMNIDPGNTFQSVHIQSLELPVTSCTTQQTCYAVPVAQPTLGSLTPATTCSPTNPLSPCMPQAIQLGKTATVRVLGQGFSSGGGNPVVRLDGQTAITPPGQNTAVPIVTTPVSDSEVDVTIPAAVLFTPHDFALDVLVGTSQLSNAIDLHAVGVLDMSAACTPTAAFPQGPEAVAIDATRRVALVTNYACNNVSVIAIDPAGFVKSDGSGIAPFGTILATVGVGPNPIGIDVISRLGYAVVANNGGSPSGTATIIDISTADKPQVVSWTPASSTTTSNAVTLGLSPVGLTIDQDRALALVANSGSNTLSAIDLTVFLPTYPAAGGGHTQGAPSATTIALSGPPTAIAVDPNRAEAVVTNLQNSGAASVTGGLDVVDLASNPPSKVTTSSISSLIANPTGIVYDPAVSPALFYVTSTQENAVYSFNPDSTTTQLIRVGINPYSVGYNYQTGTLLTINSTSNTSSVIDSQNFKTRQTLGISSLSQFSVAVDNLTNTAVIPDQNNNRVVFLALPK